MRRLPVLLTALLLPLALSACAAATGPKFDGPWAAEFEDAYTSTTSDYVRAVLEDGTVSEQEYAETVTRYKDCLDSVGIIVNELLPTGEMNYSYTEGNSDDAVAAEKTCSTQSGFYPIGMLYNWVYANPQKRDVAEITSACLVRAGAVSPGYSADDYRKEVPTSKFSLIVDDLTGQDALTQCANAPLTAFTG